MQRIRIFGAVVSLFAMLGLTSGAIAAQKKNDNPPARATQSHVQKEMKAPRKGWIAKILDDVADKLSTPPG
ncbi:MAG TPA: hypothetical protein VNN25_07760 [Thermoanaerobaculia bacterium]|nr:hypothetical protein [Thermoanaerobaculia bacterium]